MPITINKPKNSMRTWTPAPAPLGAAKLQRFPSATPTCGQGILGMPPNSRSSSKVSDEKNVPLGLTRSESTPANDIKFSNNNCSTISNASTRFTAIIGAKPKHFSRGGNSTTLTAATETESVRDLDEPHHELAKTWQLWEKFEDAQLRARWGEGKNPADTVDYQKACKQIKIFSTIENFFELFNGCPKPSAILDMSQHIVRSSIKSYDNLDEGSWKLSGKKSLALSEQEDEPANIDSIMFFEDGVSPVWEDPAHEKGGVFRFACKTDLPGSAVDAMWERLLFSVMGNTIPVSEKITGFRMCAREPLPENFKHKKQAGVAEVSVRFELWHREMNEDQVKEMREFITNLIKIPLDDGSRILAAKCQRKGTVHKCNLEYQGSGTYDPKEEVKNMWQRIRPCIKPSNSFCSDMSPKNTAKKEKNQKKVVARSKTENFSLKSMAENFEKKNCLQGHKSENRFGIVNDSASESTSIRSGSESRKSANSVASFRRMSKSSLSLAQKAAIKSTNQDAASERVSKRKQQRKHSQGTMSQNSSGNKSQNLSGNKSNNLPGNKSNNLSWANMARKSMSK